MKKEITLKVKPGQWGELAKIAEDIRTMEKECWQGRKMGSGAVALLLNGYANRIEIALGIQPRPKPYYTPPAALDVIAGDRPLDAVMRNPPFAEEKPLYAENLRKAGIRSGCFAYSVAAAVVVVLLALPGIIMAVAGWLAGGAL